MTMRDTFSQFTAGKYFVLTGALISLIFSRAIDQTFYYRISYSFQAYVWVLGTIILPVAFLAISWPVVWYKLAKTDDITPEMKAFPKYKYAIMATFDTAFNLFSTFPIYHLGSDVSNVLSQAVLPINMIMSIIFLRTKFKQTHYIGAALCAYGMAVRLIPTFDDFNAQGGWILMLILAQIPAAASNVYKEIGLKGADLDVWYANAWISTFQLLFGVFTIWTVNVKAFMAPHDPIPWSKFGDYLGEAFTCFAGHPVHDSISGETHDYCTDLPYRTFLFFIVFNLTYNQLMLVVFKQGSSVLFVIASAVRLPLVDLFCMSKFLAGPAQQDFSLYDGFALFVLVLAIYIYYSHPEDRAPEGVVQDSEDVEGGKDDLGNLIVSPHVGRTSMYQHQRQGPDRNEPLLGDERTRSDHTSYRTRSASRG